MDRVMIFVDGPNIGQRPDLARLAERLVKGRHLVGFKVYESEARR